MDQNVFIPVNAFIYIIILFIYILSSIDSLMFGTFNVLDPGYHNLLPVPSVLKFL